MRAGLAAILIPAMSPAHAAAPALQPALAGLSFLVGHWKNGKGMAHDTGASTTGSSAFTAEANGAVLLRRDHTDLHDAKGAAAGGFDQIMMIYAENGQVRADYAGGNHVIHYTSAMIKPGRSVTFSSAGQPVFTLAYTLENSNTLAVAFSMTPPGSAAAHPIATGALTRQP